MQYAGRDASEPFNQLHSPAAKRLLRTLLVGELASTAGSVHHHSEAARAQQRRRMEGGGAATHGTQQQAAAEAQAAVAECVNVDDVQRLAAARLTVGAAAYYSAGAEDGVSLADNLKMWRRWALQPRVLVDVSHVLTTTSLLGVQVKTLTPSSPPRRLLQRRLRPLAACSQRLGLQRRLAVPTAAMCDDTPSTSQTHVALSGEVERKRTLGARAAERAVRLGSAGQLSVL
jgi:hypothetical protein